MLWSKPSSPQGSSEVDALTQRWRSGRVTHGALSVSFSLQSRPQRGQHSARLYPLLAFVHTHTHTARGMQESAFMAAKLFIAQGTPHERYSLMDNVKCKRQRNSSRDNKEINKCCCDLSGNKAERIMFHKTLPR